MVLALLLLAACAGGPDPCAQKRTPTPIDAATTGTVTGRVRFDGTPPATKAPGMTSDCAGLHHGTPVTPEDVVVHDGAVENAFVYVKDGLGDRVFAVPDAVVTVDQTGCVYRPHVVGVQVCQPLEFVNGDPLLHNVHGTPRRSASWNFSMGVQGSKRTTRLAQPEVMVEVRCDVHPWMQAYIGVLDHPFFAVTGADGRFAMRGLPAGDYVVASWHERFGTREEHVTLAPGGTQDISLAYAPH